MKKESYIWTDEIPKGDFVSSSPTYKVGEYFDLYEEDIYKTRGLKEFSQMKYYFYDPTKHGYPEGGLYPLLIFLHGSSNALEGKVCVNYSGAELYASPSYQKDFGGSYILVPIANEYIAGDGQLKGKWSEEYTKDLKDLIEEFITKHTAGVGKKFLFGNSSGGAMTFRMANEYLNYFDAIIPVGASEIPEDSMLDKYEASGMKFFLAIGKRDELNDYPNKVLPRLDKLKAMKGCFVYDPDWVRNGDGGIASINFGIEMGQHCLMNGIQTNLKFDDGRPMDERLPRGMTGWIDEVNRDGLGRGRDYSPHGSYLKTGHVEIEDGISLFYEEYGSGQRIILSSQVGFYHKGMQQKMAELGYHVYCITMRGFHPSTLIEEDYGDSWYDIFAGDVLSFADKMNIKSFTYMGASHGAGIGWHLMLKNSGRVDAFIAVVAGPHSLKEGTMSYRQMIEQGIIECVPPFDPPIDDDAARSRRRKYREDWLKDSPKKAFEAERKLDYGRPMMKFKTEEGLCEALRSIEVPTLLIGGYDDPISKPELMMRTAGCLKHCKLVIYSNAGHNIDTDLIEEVSDEADRFIKNAVKTGKWYLPVEE